MITIPAERMSEAASALSVLARDNQVKPILGTVRLCSKGGKLSMSACNLEAFGTIQIEGAEIDGEAECCVPATKLFGFHGNYPKDFLRVSPNGTGCTLTAASSRLKLQTMPAADFPAMKSPDILIGTIPDGVLPSASRIGFTLKREFTNDRVSIQGPGLVCHEHELYIAGFDGRAVAVQKLGKSECEFGSMQIVDSSLSLFRTLDGEVRICSDNNAVSFRDHSREYICRRIECPYPPVFKNQIKKREATAYAVREILLRELKSASMATDINSIGCEVKIGGGQIQLSSKSQVGESFASLPSDCDGSYRADFDAKLLSDAVASFPAGCSIFIESGDTKIRLSSEEHGYFTLIAGMVP